MKTTTRALTLIEGLILGGLFLFLAILVVPQVRGARIATNESEAAQTLKALEKAVRESGWKEEGSTAPDLEKILEILRRNRPDMELLPPPGDGGPPLFRYHGYLFALWASPGSPLTIYAWPTRLGSSGIAVFYLNPQGKIFFCRNLRERYSGIQVRPDPNAAVPMPAPGGKKPKIEADGSYLGQDYQRWVPLAGE